VERANVLNNRQKLANLAHYYDSSDLLDPSSQVRHRHDISRAVVMKSINQFAVVVSSFLLLSVIFPLHSRNDDVLQEDHKNSIFFFNSRHARLIHTITTEAAPIAIEYVQDKEKDLLIATGADMTMSTYSLDDPNPNRRYQHLQSWATPGVQMTLTYQPESKILYSGGTNGNIYSWNIKERNLISTLSGHTDIVMSLTNIPHLNNVASASLDKTIAVWDSYSNERILHLHGHRKGIFDLTYSSEYRLLVSCGFEHDAFVWSPFVNNLMGRLRGHHASLVGCIAIEGTPELITGDADGVFKLWDVRNFNCVQTFTSTENQQHGNDNYRMSCFFFTSLPSRNAMQKEDDSRIYAASKMLSSFDQARIVHEATTDKTNVFWLTFNAERSTFVTVSERNVMIWDAFMGSTTTVNLNICGEEITACCLDDRRRKIIIGNIAGNIAVYNLSNGSLMKQVEKSNGNYGTVMSLAYVDASKRFIAAYQYGNISIYDENTLEECMFIRSFETINKSRTVNRTQDIDDTHDGFARICYNPYDFTVISTAPASNYAKIWNYNTGKIEFELHACNDENEFIVNVEFLSPYPLVCTCDSVGNVVVWGSRGCKWPGMRIGGFLNQNVLNGAYKQNETVYSFSEEVHPPMVIPIEANLATENVNPISVRGSRASSPIAGAVPSSSRYQRRFFSDREDDSRGSPRRSAEDKMIQSPIGSNKFLSNDYLKALKYMDSAQNDHAIASVNEVKILVQQSEEKWGSIASVQCMSWQHEQKMLFVADDMGILRCYDLKDLLYDICADSMLQQSPSSRGDYHLREYCRQHPRTVKSALPPCHQTFFRYLVGKPDDAMSNMGINFVWSLLAHNDRIVTCHCTSSGILTSAVDRLVKMWTFNGEPIGRLLQSVPTGVRNKAWKLELDAAAIMKRENEELDEILHKVDVLASKTDNPSIEEGDFTGLDPGENAADFNRSELRRRIDITGKLLGLDFSTNANNSRRESSATLNDDAFGFNLSVSTEPSTQLDSLSKEMKHASIHSSSVGSKTVDSAMKELKSLSSSINYDSYNRSLSDRQRRMRTKKMNKLSSRLIDTVNQKIGSTASNPMILSMSENEEVIRKAHQDFDDLALESLNKSFAVKAPTSRLDSLSLEDAHEVEVESSRNHSQLSSRQSPNKSASSNHILPKIGLQVVSSSKHTPSFRTPFNTRSHATLHKSADLAKEYSQSFRITSQCSKYSSYQGLEEALSLAEKPAQLNSFKSYRKPDPNGVGRKGSARFQITIRRTYTDEEEDARRDDDVFDKADNHQHDFIRHKSSMATMLTRTNSAMELDG
jgi:WD40 repeat protein